MLSKKLYGLLLPILAVAAFGATAGAAQAALPHWTVNNIRLVFGGPKVPVVTKGRLTLTNAAIGTVECEVKDKGNIWNPSATEPGKDEVTEFKNEHCVSSSCTAGLEVLAEGLPWPTELEEVPAGSGVFRDKIKGIQIRVKCTSPTMVNLLFTGELTPKFVAGTPSAFEFDAASGSLTSAAGPGTVRGDDSVETETGATVGVKAP